MAEYRVHWEENGVVKYEWHSDRRRARRALRSRRLALGLHWRLFNTENSIVKFDVLTMKKVDLMDFLNEHICEGPVCGTLQNAA